MGAMKAWGCVALAVILGYLYMDSSNPESLAGSRVIVTGASTGIGEEMAYHYARAGAQLVLTARREHALQKVKTKCLELGAKQVSLVLADMGEADARIQVVEQAVRDLGGLDYLVLNHIGATPFQMWEGDVSHVRWLMEVNFVSYVDLATAALPHLAQSNGSIVVLSSITGKSPIPFAAPYAATKAALEGFFVALRHELNMRQTPVSITLCILGLIDTESAMEKSKGKVSIAAYPAQDAAYAVVSAGARRVKEMYYPWYVRPACFFRDWFPEWRDWAVLQTFHYKPEEQKEPA